MSNESDGNIDGIELSLGLAAALSKSLSDPNRLRILLSLCNGKKTVSNLVAEFNLSQPLVSHHMRELRYSLLVRVERKGAFVIYELADERIGHIIKQLAQLATDLTSNRTLL